MVGLLRSLLQLVRIDERQNQKKLNNINKLVAPSRGLVAPRRGPCECSYFSVLEESGDAQSFCTVQGLSKSDVPTFFGRVDPLLPSLTGFGAASLLTEADISKRRGSAVPEQGVLR
jgi:hypothetical protein